LFQRDLTRGGRASLVQVIGRPHTGSRRNDAAEQAILPASAELLAAGDGALITVAAIAARQIPPLEGHDTADDVAAAFATQLASSLDAQRQEG
jgi:hypothetical protein